jgi:hypothetical protein
LAQYTFSLSSRHTLSAASASRFFASFCCTLSPALSEPTQSQGIQTLACTVYFAQIIKGCILMIADIMRWARHTP